MITLHLPYELAIGEDSPKVNESSSLHREWYRDANCSFICKMNALQNGKQVKCPPTSE